ncbi:hypothetical protein [Priestia koreensis]|uniref:hypothetical protein n=1 Tax=Priestia koreensis TaxID=284581 RepID=UPI00203F2C4C|nr:hypothetical protein [Priestia koreensis]MCM3006832.1 hypothetical protein [Priestia koreensis]
MLKDVVLLSDQEQKEFLNAVNENPIYKKLAIQIEEVAAGSLENLMVTESIKGVTAGDEKEVNFKSVVLLNKDKKVKIYIIESEALGEKEFNVSADVATADGKNILGFMNKLDEIDLFFTTDYDPSYFEETRFGVELSSVEKNELKAQGWTGKFCLVECTGQYNHCGPGCGQYGPLGGGSLVNKIDGCCFIHDYCYHNKKKSQGCCDNDLITCAGNNKSADYCAWLDITAYFSWFGGKC